MNSVGRSPVIRLGTLIVIFFTVLCTDAAAQQAGLPPEVIAYADTIFYNGKIYTADENFTTVEAVAIRDNKFMAVGDNARITAMAGPKTKQIDLKGKGVIPGVIDLHQHPFTEGIMAYWANKWMPNEPEWTTVEQALEAIKRAVARAKPGEPVLLPRIYIGPGIGEEGGREGESICDVMSSEEKYRATLPCAARNTGTICQVLTREQLDSVSPNNPVVFVAVVNMGAHAINTKAAEAIKPYLRDTDTQQIFEKEGNICTVGSRHSKFNRRPDEVFWPQALIKDYLMFWHEPLENQMVGYRDATNGISAGGITLTKEHLALPLITGIRELWARGELTVRMRIPYPLTPLTSDSPVISIPKDMAETLFRRIGNMSGIGDDVLRFTGPRIGLGGNLVGGEAWTLESRIRPYTSPGGALAKPYGAGGPGEGFRGPLKPGDEIFPGREALVQAVRFGWDFSSDHTIGDRAVREVLNAMEEGLQKQIVKRPHQLLHLGHTPIVRLEDIQRMNKLGVNATIAAWHIWLPSMVEAGVTQFGTEKFDKMAAPMKSYIQIGSHPGLEGDVPGPMFWRIEKAVTRKDDLYKRTWNASEAVTRQEALWMSTLWPAEIINEQDRLGSIEPGKLADLVVVDKDYLSVPADDLSEIQVLLTMMDGKVVFQVEGAIE